MNDQLVQKRGELFVVCDERGDINPGLAGSGLYFRDMRHLSHLALEVVGYRLELLDSTSTAIDRLNIVLTNDGTGYDAVPPHSVSISRERDLGGGERLLERIAVTNHTREAIHLPLRVAIASDFLDMFAVRGYFTYEREASPQFAFVSDSVRELRYTSVDGTRYVTNVRFPEASKVEPLDGGTAAGFVVTHGLWIEASTRTELIYEIEVGVETSGGARERPGAAGSSSLAPRAEIVTSNETFNAILRRSIADLDALTTPFPGTPGMIAAGIPWYVAPFGRDSLIAARQSLWLDPTTLASTLRFLASAQGERDDPERDEAPGKIVHEMRFGEAARRNLVPFSRYYGTVDATPLFLVMLFEYVRWTGDLPLFSELRHNVERALSWIDTSGDTNGDGFVDYERQAERGLLNQGWKDSWDSLQHLDGSPVPGPIALVEVQGYVYRAKRGMAECFALIGDDDRAIRLRAEAAELRARIEDVFWMNHERHYAEAVDGVARPAAALVSNQGHLLSSGVPRGDRAANVSRLLLSDGMRSGWGIRTLSSDMPHYNPVSYHRGSVWPHDNAFVLWGFRCYRQLDALEILATELFEAAARSPLYRLPELFCGYDRSDDPWATPVAYPTTCSPQAWAAGVPFVIIETLLGLQVDGAARTVALDPWLPDWLGWVRVTGLPVADTRLDLEVSGAGEDVEIVVHDNPGGVVASCGTTAS